MAHFHFSSYQYNHNNHNHNNKYKTKLDNNNNLREPEKWVNDAINPARMLWEFTKLEVVKSGLAVWNPMPINRSLPSEVQIKLNYIQQERKHFDPYNRSRYEMDEANFGKLSKAFESTFPDAFRALETIRKEMPQKMSKYKK